MIAKLLEVSKLKKEAAEARLSLHLSKCQIVGNLMLWLIIITVHFFLLQCLLVFR